MSAKESAEAVDFVPMSARSLSAIEPVSATAKRKLENGEQRPAPETYPQGPKYRKLPTRDWGAPANAVTARTLRKADRGEDLVRSKPPICSASSGFNADAGSHRAVPPRHPPRQKAGQG